MTRADWILVPLGVLFVIIAFGQVPLMLYEDVDPNALVTDWSDAAIRFAGSSADRTELRELVEPEAPTPNPADQHPSRY